MDNKSYLVLALDLGVKSVGAVLVDLSINGKESFIEGTDFILNDTEARTQSGGSRVKSQDRRTARGARRRLDRAQMRRDYLFSLLGSSFDELSELKDISAANEAWAKLLSIAKEEMGEEELENLRSLQAYQWRAEALDRLLQPHELAIALLHINKRRGYSSNRKADSSSDEDSKSDIKNTIKAYEQTVLSKDNSIRTLGELLWKTIEEEMQTWTHSKDNARQVSAFLTKEKVRDQHFGRKLYEFEVEKILYAQWKHWQEAHPDSENPYSRKFKRDIKRAIFSQRSLKSQRLTRFDCPYESRKVFNEKKKKWVKMPLKAMAKSHPDYQDFRILQVLHNIKVGNSAEERDFLSPEQKYKLWNTIREAKYITPQLIRNTLSLATGVSINFDSGNEDDKIKGNQTVPAIREALPERDLSMQEIEVIWHACHSAERDSKLLKTLKKGLKVSSNKKLTFTKEEINALIAVKLEGGYTQISHCAVSKLNKEMYPTENTAGLSLSEAKEKLGYTDELIGKSIDYYHKMSKEELKKSVLNLGLKQHELNNPRAQRTLSAALRIVKDMYKKHIFNSDKYERIDEIVIENARELKQSIKVRGEIDRANQDKKNRRDRYREFLIKKKVKNFNANSKTDILKFELWLELNYVENEELGKLDARDIKAFQGFSDSHRLFKPNPKAKTKSEKQAEAVRVKELKAKFQLWKEADRTCLYTGSKISLSTLFSEAVEIEHIIPRAYGGDNSFMNKTLSDIRSNRRKGERTPYEYLKESQEWTKFKARIRKLSKSFPKQKKAYLLDKRPGGEIAAEMFNSLLNDTAYIAIKAREHLSKVAKTLTVKGTHTSMLRRMWGLDSVLYDDGLGNEILRGDYQRTTFLLEQIKRGELTTLPAAHLATGDDNKKVREAVMEKYMLWLELPPAKKIKAWPTDKEIRDYFTFSQDYLKTTDKEAEKKYQNWLGTDRLTLFPKEEEGGEAITLNQLFTQEVVKAEINPRWTNLHYRKPRLNETLMWDSVAEAKGDNAPFAFYGSNEESAAWKSFCERVKQMPEVVTAKKMLLEQVGSKGEDQLNQAVRKSFLYATEYKLPTKKLRADHRHHLVDALTLAYSRCRNVRAKLYYLGKQENGRYRVTEPYANATDLLTLEGKKWIEHTKNEDKVYYRPFLSAIQILPPWLGFRNDIKEIVKNAVVVHEKDKPRILSKRKQYFEKDGKIQAHTHIGVRGELHSANPYGEVILAEDVGKYKRGMRVRVSGLNILDPLKEFKINPKKPLEEQAFHKVIDRKTRVTLLAFLRDALEDPETKSAKNPVKAYLDKLNSQLPEEEKMTGVPHQYLQLKEDPNFKPKVFIKQVRIITKDGNSLFKPIPQPGKIVNFSQTDAKAITPEQIFGIRNVELRSTVVGFIAKENPSWNLKPAQLTKDHLKTAFAIPSDAVKTILKECSSKLTAKEAARLKKGSVQVDMNTNAAIRIAEKRYVISAETVAAAVYECKGKKPKILTVSLFEAGNRLARQQDLFDKTKMIGGGAKQSLFTKTLEVMGGDYFIIIPPSEKLNQETLKRTTFPEWLYRVTHFAEGSITLLWHQTNNDHPGIESNNSYAPVYSRTVIQDDALEYLTLKVKLTLLGELTPKSLTRVHAEIERRIAAQEKESEK